MNWKKLTESTPPFGKLVLLFEHGDSENFADCGSLKSIDKDGFHWDFGTLMDIFGSAVLVPQRRQSRKFTPTHWCEIIPPQKD